MAGNALVLAGSGMLSSVACQLVRDGWRVVLPCRRYSALPVDEADTGTSRQQRPGPQAIWVEAHWDRPRELARGVEKVLTAPAGLLVAWVHESYRRSVIGAVETLLAPGAPVVEVRGPNESAVQPEAPEPVLFGHPTQQIMLGAVSEGDWQRPLGHDEVVEGVRQAVERAVEGRPSCLHQIGGYRLARGYREASASRRVSAGPRN